jgi:hypothetical protein
LLGELLEGKPHEQFLWGGAGNGRGNSAPRQSLTRQNFGFNELVNGWEADHIYKHEAKAIEAFLLMAFLACNIFHAFLTLNLKPQLRDTKPEKYWACLIAAELYRDAGTTTRKRAP